VPTELRKEYVSSFSVATWGDLPSGRQLLHTMSKCLACARDYGSLQKAFPAKPLFVPPCIVDITIPMDMTERKVTGTIMKELNQ
jgi:hypothetical protein